MAKSSKKPKGRGKGRPLPSVGGVQPIGDLPTSFDIAEDTTQKILELVRGGAFREPACAQTGTSSRTLRRWLTRADLDVARGRLTSPYVRFAEALERAESESENRNVLTLQVTAKGDWRAAAWWLERKHWQRWGDAKTRHEIDAMVTTLLDAFGREFASEPEVMERILLAAARATSGEQHDPGQAGAAAEHNAGGGGTAPPTAH